MASIKAAVGGTGPAAYSGASVSPRPMATSLCSARFARVLALLAATAAAPASAQWAPMTSPPSGGTLSRLDAPTGALLATNSAATFRLADGAWTPLPAPVWETAVGAERVLARTAGAAGSGGGLALSTDAGATFAPLPIAGASLRPLAVDGLVLVAHDNDSLRVSTDEGATWRAEQDSAWVTVTFGGGSSSTFPVALHGAVGAVVEGDALLVAATSYVFGGVFRLAPSDTAWVPLVRPGTTDIQSGEQPLSLVRHGGALWFSHTGGALRSDDGGLTWTDVSAGLPGTFGVELHAGEVGLVAASRTGSGLALWTDGGWAAVPMPPGSLRAVGVNEAIHVLTTDGGFTWDGAAWVPLPALESSSPLPLLAPAGDLFVSVDARLWRSPDDGATWTLVLPGHSGHLLPHNGALVATAGTDVTRSTDGGATWTPTAQPTLPSSATIRRPASLVSHGGALYGAYGYERRGKHGVLLEQYGNVFRSTDDGATWTALTAGLPMGQAGRSPVGRLVAFDDGTLVAIAAHGCVALVGASWAARPCPPGSTTLEVRADGARRIARTDVGLFASADGTAWTRVTDGLPGPASSHLFWYGLRLVETPGGLVAVGAADGTGTAWRLDGDAWTALPWTFPAGVTWNGFLADGDALIGGSVGRGLWRFDGGLVGTTDGTDGLALALDAPTPNPAAGAVRVRFALPSAGTAEVAVFDALGRRVATLAGGALAGGPHAATWDARGAAPGVYVVRLTAPSGVRTQRVVVTR